MLPHNRFLAVRDSLCSLCFLGAVPASAHLAADRPESALPFPLAFGAPCLRAPAHQSPGIPFALSVLPERPPLPHITQRSNEIRRANGASSPKIAFRARCVARRAIFGPIGEVDKKQRKAGKPVTWYYTNPSRTPSLNGPPNQPKNRLPCRRLGSKSDFCLMEGAEGDFWIRSQKEGDIRGDFWEEIQKRTALEAIFG